MSVFDDLTLMCLEVTILCSCLMYLDQCVGEVYFGPQPFSPFPLPAAPINRGVLPLRLIPLLLSLAVKHL